MAKLPPNKPTPPSRRELQEGRTIPMPRPQVVPASPSPTGPPPKSPEK